MAKQQINGIINDFYTFWNECIPARSTQPARSSQQQPAAAPTIIYFIALRFYMSALLLFGSSAVATTCLAASNHAHTPSKFHPIVQYPSPITLPFRSIIFLLILRFCFSFSFLLFYFHLFLFSKLQVVQEYERAVIFRLGRLMQGGAKGPGEYTQNFYRIFRQLWRKFWKFW